jgi:hypothetical protein
VAAGKALWITDHAAAVAEADRTGKAILYWFTDPVGCIPCRLIESGALAEDGVRAELGKMICLKADVTTPAGDRLRKRFNVESVPRLILYRNDVLVGFRAGNVTGDSVLRLLAGEPDQAAFIPVPFPPITLGSCSTCSSGSPGR